MEFVLVKNPDQNFSVWTHISALFGGHPAPNNQDASAIETIKKDFPIIWTIVSDRSGNKVSSRSLMSVIKKYNKNREVPIDSVSALLSHLRAPPRKRFKQFPGLEVKQSLIPNAGQGLFATQKFTAGSTMCEYDGTHMTLAQLVSKCNNSDYVMGGFGINCWIDARNHPEVQARYINDNFNVEKINAKFDKSRVAKKAFVKALRDIDPGEEIYASYGAVYWRKRNATTNQNSSSASAPANHTVSSVSTNQTATLPSISSSERERSPSPAK